MNDFKRHEPLLYRLQQSSWTITVDTLNQIVVIHFKQPEEVERHELYYYQPEEDRHEPFPTTGRTKFTIKCVRVATHYVLMMLREKNGLLFSLHISSVSMIEKTKKKRANEKKISSNVA